MRWLFLAISLSFLSVASAQETPTPAPVETIFRLGSITVDREAKTVRFPATVQLTSGALEYLLVTEEGKTHESLLVTKVSPYKLHVAMLLLGASAAKQTKELPPAQLNAANLKTAPELTGDKVDILVSWKVNDEEKQVSVVEWVHNQLTKTTMTPEPWIYTSSTIYKGTFLAQQEGSIVALVTDPVALINNPRPGNHDDSIWSVEKEKVPPANTAVEITFQILPKSTESARSSSK